VVPFQQYAYCMANDPPPPPLIAHPSDIAKYVLQLHSDTDSLKFYLPRWIQQSASESVGRIPSLAH
jgi:hypothetical protein